MARAKSYTCGIDVGGLPPTTPRRSKMGLLDVYVRSPLSISVVGSLRVPKRDSHGFGACARRLASERRPGRADGVAPTRARSSRRNDTADVDWRRTRPGTGQGATTAGVLSSPQHFRDERMAGARVLPDAQNPKSTTQFCHRIDRAPLVWCTARAVGVRNSKLRNPLLPVRNTGSKRSSHAVFGARQATRLLISCSTSS